MLGLAAVVLFNGCTSPQAVTTYHYDNLRTGWNSNEVKLGFDNVGSSSFALLPPVTLDDQVDTQPLIVPNETIDGGGPVAGKHDVVYVATEGNTIYAIDASSGAILLSPNFGPPVPEPLGCNNNGPNVGINGTPVIDVASNTMYVITYTNDGPTYRIHALNLSSLKDKVPPVVVSASHTLTDGTTFPFKAKFQRQRPALLEANGNIYAGFGSFCDYNWESSRGRLLGWKVGSLTPLPANQLNDRLSTSPHSEFLSSIWMAGYGVAADADGNLYFATGNSDKSGTTYEGTRNISESVAKASPDLTKFTVFTPSNVGDLDQHDTDFGSGGVLLLPEQNGSIPRLAAAAGKDGNMYLLNRDNLGGLAQGDPHTAHGGLIDPPKQIGGCFCGQSYFGGSPPNLIVSSGGDKVSV